MDGVWPGVFSGSVEEIGGDACLPGGVVVEALGVADMDYFFWSDVEFLADHGVELGDFFDGVEV